MKKFALLTSTLFVFAFFVGILFSSRFATLILAEKSNPHTEWQETPGNWGDCILTDDGAIQTRINKFVCESKSGNKENECILGTAREETESKKCELKRAYCHATSADENPYNYHFNSAWDTHLLNNGTPLAGHEGDFLTWEGDENCTGYIKVCTDSTALNYDSELAINELSDNKICEYKETQSTPTPNNGDICPNLDGIQTELPTDYHFDAGHVNCVQFSVPGAPESSSVDTGTVLGASTGQVLGVSSMANTGVVEDSIFYSIFSLGSLLTSLGIMKNGKKRS